MTVRVAVPRNLRTKANPAHGFPCPACGMGTAVTITLLGPDGQSIVRYRACRCGHRTKTVERAVPYVRPNR